MDRRRIAVFVSLALAVPCAARAQRTGAIIGTVYDSLASTTLEGARVWVRGSSRSAFTGTEGRFRLDSVAPGPQVVLFEHPALDSVGLTTNAARTIVFAGRAVEISLATRSAATLRTGLCPYGARGPLGDSGVVFGTARNAHGGTRLAGARVSIAWTTASRNPDGRILIERPSVEATTDSTGAYYACGVPTELVVVARLRADSFSSGEAEILVGRRGFFRQDLTVSLEPGDAPRPLAGPTSAAAAAVTQPRAAAPLRGTAVLAGRVIDERGQPRSGVRVVVDDVDGEARTGAAGEFVLTGLPAGTHMAMARHVGYSAARLPVELRNRDTIRVQFRIRSVTMLDTIRVLSTPRVQRELDEIAMRQRIGGGYLLGEAEIRTRSTMRAAIDGIPGAQTTSSTSMSTASGFNFRVLFTAPGGRTVCEPTIWIDGIRASIEELAAYRPANIIALEAYPRASAALGRYTAINDCGVILAWTRSMR